MLTQIYNPSRGGVLPMWWVIHMCRGFDPLFSLWQDRARSFWGIFSHPPTPKRSFGVLKLPILTEFDLLGPKFHFSLDLFGSNLQRPAAHPHHFSDRVPPPGNPLSVAMRCKHPMMCQTWACAGLHPPSSGTFQGGLQANCAISVWKNVFKHKNIYHVLHKNSTCTGLIFWKYMYRKVSNIWRTKSQNLNDSHLVLKSSLPNPLKPGVKSRMKM